MPHSYPFPQPTPVDPAPLLAELRQREPVSRIVMPWGDPAYLVTRYQDARQGTPCCGDWSPRCSRHAGWNVHGR